MLQGKKNDNLRKIAQERIDALIGRDALETEAESKKSAAQLHQYFLDNEYTEDDIKQYNEIYKTLLNETYKKNDLERNAKEAFDFFKSKISSGETYKESVHKTWKFAINEHYRYFVHEYNDDDVLHYYNAHLSSLIEDFKTEDLKRVATETAKKFDSLEEGKNDYKQSVCSIVQNAIKYFQDQGYQPADIAESKKMLYALAPIDEHNKIKDRSSFIREIGKNPLIALLVDSNQDNPETLITMADTINIAYNATQNEACSSSRSPGK